MDDLYRGQRLGKYEILTQLTLGGMAELFLAFTSGPGGFRKYVVVKRILPDVKADDQFVNMFLDEARISAAFSHPNIAQVFDLDEDEDGLFLAMEFISGQNLNQVSSGCNRQKRIIPIGFSCTVARDLCNALHYAHTFTDPIGRPSPVIHRDVAQKNVMVTYDGVVKLLDFGIAKAKGKLGRTNVGMVKGTTGYMSPEQVRGEEIDGRSDVFSVGVVLYEMLSGKRLFSAETETDEMRRILEAPIKPIGELNDLISEDLSAVVMRALSRERSDRFTTAREMAKALERAAGKLLYDQEQIATLMKELFAERMAATQALLESAGSPDASLLAKAAVVALRSSEPEGLSFEESVLAKDGKAVARVHDTRETAPPPRDDATVAMQAKVDEVVNEKESRLGVIFAFLVAVGVVAGGYGVWKFVFSLPPAPEDLVPEEALQAQPLSTWNDPRVKPYQEPGAPAEEKPPAPADPALAVVPLETNEPPRSKRKKEARQRAAKGEGTLTLITVPDSTVMRGASVLGPTPLWNAKLPAGTHLLRLKGPDGKVRLLSTPIEANKNTAFRINLADLPVE